MSFGSQLDPNQQRRAWGTGQPSYQNGYQPLYTPQNPSSEGGTGHRKTVAGQEYDQFEEAVKQVTSTLENMAYNFRKIVIGINSIGSPKDTEEFRGALNRTIEDTRAIAKDVANIIKQLNNLNAGTNEEKREKKQKIQKIQSDFEKFNDKFKEQIKIANERMSAVSPKVPQPQLQEPQLISVPYNEEEDDDQKAALLSRQQDLMQVDNEYEHMDNLITERDQDIHKIQSQMIEVNEIMKDLASLVREQGEMIDNIETNIEHTAQNTTEAVQEVKKASEYQQKARNKLCIVAIVILIIVAIITVVIVVLNVK